MDTAIAFLMGGVVGVVLSALADRDIRLPTPIGRRLDHWRVPSLGSEGMSEGEHVPIGEAVDIELISPAMSVMGDDERAVVAALLERERVRRGSR